jgi:hypothetical protein
MKFSNIVFEEIDKVARITFNRLDVRNALNLELLGEMIQVVEYLSKNDKIRALIITGLQLQVVPTDYLENDLQAARLRSTRSDRVLRQSSLVAAQTVSGDCGHQQPRRGHASICP